MRTEMRLCGWARVRGVRDCGERWQYRIAGFEDEAYLSGSHGRLAIIACVGIVILEVFYD